MFSRTQYSEDLFSFLNEHLGTGPTAGHFQQITGKGSHILLTFGTSRTLDGSVHVYGENFVLIKWNTTYRGLPGVGRRVYTAENARKFIQLAFVYFKFEEAEAIPTAQ